MQFYGKVAVATGASRGIGARIALNLAERGAAVVYQLCRRQVDAERLAEDIERGGG